MKAIWQFATVKCVFFFLFLILSLGISEKLSTLGSKNDDYQRKDIETRRWDF